MTQAPVETPAEALKRIIEEAKAKAAAPVAAAATSGGSTSTSRSTTTTPKAPFVPTNFAATGVANERTQQLSTGRYKEEADLQAQGFLKIGDGVYVNPKTRETWNIDASSGLWSTNGFRASAADVAEAIKSARATGANIDNQGIARASSVNSPASRGTPFSSGRNYFGSAYTSREGRPSTLPGLAQRVGVSPYERNSRRQAPGFLNDLAYDAPMGYKPSTAFQNGAPMLSMGGGELEVTGYGQSQYRAPPTESNAGMGTRGVNSDLTLAAYGLRPTGDPVGDAMLAQSIVSKREDYLSQGMSLEQANDLLQPQGREQTDLGIGESTAYRGPAGGPEMTMTRTEGGYSFNPTPGFRKGGSVRVLPGFATGGSVSAGGWGGGWTTAPSDDYVADPTPTNSYLGWNESSTPAPAPQPITATPIAPTYQPPTAPSVGVPSTPTSPYQQMINLPQEPMPTPPPYSGGPYTPYVPGAGLSADALRQAAEARALAMRHVNNLYNRYDLAGVTRPSFVEVGSLQPGMKAPNGVIYQTADYADQYLGLEQRIQALGEGDLNALWQQRYDLIGQLQGMDPTKPGFDPAARAAIQRSIDLLDTQIDRAMQREELLRQRDTVAANLQNQGGYGGIGLGFAKGGTVTAGASRFRVLPGLAGGPQQMTTQEPIVGIGMRSRRPQFVVGEDGAEMLNIIPMNKLPGLRRSA